MFPNKKEAEINALQRFQLLLLYLIIRLEHNTHLIPLSTAVIRYRLAFIYKAKLGVIMNLFFLTG